MRKLFPLLVFVFAIGCSGTAPKAADMTEITGTVTMGGQPVSDVVLNLQPTGEGTIAAIPVQQGKIKAMVTPGKYTYYITETPKGKAVMAKLNPKYLAGAMDRQIDIAAGSTLNITLD